MVPVKQNPEGDTQNRKTKNSKQTAAEKWASQVLLVVKNLLASAGRYKRPRVRSLGWGDPLEEGMETHSSTLTWRIPGTEEPGELQSTGSQRVEHD